MICDGASQQIGPAILKFMRPKEYEEWKNIGHDLARQSEELSRQYFSSIPDGLDSLYVTEHQKFLKALRLISRSDIRQTIEFYQFAPRMLLSLNPNIRDAVLEMCMAFCEGEAKTLIQTFNACVSALSSLSYPDQELISGYVHVIGKHSFNAARAFLYHATRIFLEIDEYLFPYWIDQGIEILKKNENDGIDYFSVCGKHGADAVKKWMSAVAYEEVESTLSIFATGLCGKKMRFEKIKDVKNPHRFYSLYMTGNKNKVMLPPYYAIGQTKKDNFRLYKIAVAYQVGYIEFGTFNHEFDTIWKGLNRFTFSGLAKDIFFIIEDARIGRLLKRQYRGLGHQLDRSLELEMAHRHLLSHYPLHHALEILLALTLNRFNGKEISPEINSEISSVIHAMNGFYENTTSSWDSFLKASEIYEYLVHLCPKSGYQQPPLLPDQDRLNLMEVPSPGKSKEEQKEIIEGDVEKQTDESLVPLKNIVCKNVQSSINMKGRPLAELNGIQSFNKDCIEEHEDTIPDKYSSAVHDTANTGDEGCFYYDEWDYIYGNYRNKWCRAFEKDIAPGHIDRYHKIKDQYNLLIRQVKKQFQRIKPVMIEKVKRVEWGEDLDLDEVIQLSVDRKMGRSPSEKIFIRREKKPQKSAILLLIDLSASTDEHVIVADRQKGEREVHGVKGSDRVNEFFPNNKKIIDILRDALVVILEALNDLGEQVGVFGFSGQGRNQVEIYPLKEFTESFNESVKGRLCNIGPKQSTRMGCAIRHSIGKLKQLASENRILILLSDGLPQDLDYGEDRTSKTYAIHDTMMAFGEAKRNGIQTFCITVDNTGNDRLKFVSNPKRYLLIQDVYSLPEVLPKIIELLMA